MKHGMTSSPRLRGSAVRADRLIIDHEDEQAPDHGLQLLIRPKAALLVVFLSALVLCLLCAWAIDVPAVNAMRQLPHALHDLAAWLTLLGLSGYMLVMSAAVAILATLALRTEPSQDRRTVASLVRQRAVFFFVAVAGSGIAAQLIKHLVGRARPKLMDTLGAFHFDAFSIKASLASFPSGHATSAFAAALTLSVMLPRWRVPLFALASLIAASRVVVEAHYVSDVVAGVALGLLFTLGMAAFFASKGWAFERRGTALALRGDGLVGRVLRSSRAGSEPAA